MSSVNFVVPAPNDGVSGHTGSVLGFFVKAPSAPASDMTLVDYNAGGSGYYRIKLTSTLHVVVEMSTTVGSGTADLGALPTGAWWWVTTDFPNGGGNRIYGVLQNGGTALAAASSALGGGGGTLTCTFGWGVSLSSGYLNFPATAGWEMSKFEHRQQGCPSANSAQMGVPTSDVSSAGLTQLYLCRETAGTASSLADATSNAYNLTPGPNGLTVVVDGPYP